MIAEPKTAHMRATARGVAEGQPGAMFFASPTRARFLIGRNEADLLNAGSAPVDTGILRRSKDWPFDRFSRVARDWEGGAVVLFGGGPSLTLAQVELVRCAVEDGRVHTIAINDAYRIVPFADVNYFADSIWHNWHRARPEFVAFAGEKCSIQNTGMSVDDPAVHLLRNKHFPLHGEGISLDPGALVTGRNSGYQALNLAILAGAKTVILLGFDGQKALDGKTHWFGEHKVPEPDAAYECYRRAFSAGERAIAATGTMVLNCSPGSAIGFEKMPLADALKVGA